MNRAAALGVAGIAALIVAAESLAALTGSEHLPAPHAIASELRELAGDADFGAALWFTLRSWWLGFIIASALGITVGFGLGAWPAARRFITSTVDFLRPIPSVSFIPVAVLIWGVEPQATMILVAYAAFWFALLQTWAGIADVDPLSIEAATTLHLPIGRRIVHVVVPQALPAVVTGLRLALTTALVVCVSAEMIIGSPGLGHEVAAARDSGATQTMYALIVVCGVLGLGADLLMRRLGRAAHRRRGPHRGGAGASAAHSSRRMRALQTWTLPMLLIGAWWFITSPSPFFPSLRTIAESAGDTWGHGHLADALGPSLVRYTIAMTIATLVGVLLGTALGMAPRFAELTTPVLEFGRAIPPPVLLPMLIVLLGIGDAMRITVIVIGCVWPILLATADGVRGVDPIVADTARVYRVPPARTALTVMLPAAAGRISAGIGQALGVGLIMLVISEMFAATAGIGADLIRFQASFAIAPMWSAVILLGLLGATVSWLHHRAERRFLRWLNEPAS